MLEALYNAAKAKDADYVWCDWFLSYDNNERYMPQPSFDKPMEALKAMLSGGMKYNVYRRDELLGVWGIDDIDDALISGIVHFNGKKPWKDVCINFDIWWEYYRRCPFFDEKWYFDFFNYKLNELDRLPLMKRIKILLRYFFCKIR